MLQLRKIHKQYQTGQLIQTALDSVSLNLRDNEFVAILGPSGSGKTTLLNIIGGLDRYDSGDLIINGISTRQYTDRDWDSYRNHTIGFVFQSYNLIPHQTVLANVELAMTISGVSRAERRKRAAEALEKVGLGKQLHKKPGEMSGGQMQRVAIARALVNNPDILLADEPTGAMDSETSIQVMELLKEVARDRLVVMVTHNPELAERYATRIVTLKDGEIRSDSMPYEPENGENTPTVHRNMGKSSMSIWTSLALSFNNLCTKKARTLLTAFAGSIGIIGIALILSLSNGVNNYIATMERETLSEYPLQIQSTGLDLTSMMTAGSSMMQSGGQKNDSDRVTVNQMLTQMFSKVNANDLASLKDYLDGGNSGIEQYASAVEYTYDVSPQIYLESGDTVRQVNPDQSFAALGVTSSASSNSLISTMMNTDVFFKLPRTASLYEDQYEVKAGRWPENERELVVVLSSGGGISDFALYSLGLRDSVELDNMIAQFSKNETVTVPDDFGTYRAEDFLGLTFRLVNAADRYVYDEAYGVWRDKSDDADYQKQLVHGGETLTVVGVVQPAEGAKASMLRSGIGYPAELTDHVIAMAQNSKIVRRQLEDPTVNVMNGEKFQSDGSTRQLDLSSLFSVDTKTLQEAFQFDESALDLDLSGALTLNPGAIDLSGALDPDALAAALPEMPELDLAQLLSKVKLTIQEDDLKTLISDLSDAYQKYAGTHPEADYSRLPEYLCEYLQTEEAQKRFSEGIRKILKETGSITVSPEALQELIEQVVAGYQAYLEENGLTDPAHYGEYLLDYLRTPEAKALIKEGASKIVQIDGDLIVRPEQLRELASDMYQGYQDYAAANGLADPSKAGQTLSDFLGQPETKTLLANALSKMVDTGELQKALSDAMEDYVRQAAGNISGVLEQQLSGVMRQMMLQLADSLQNTLSRSLSPDTVSKALSVDPEVFQKAISVNMDEANITELLRSVFTGESNSYENNLKKLGYADPDSPGAISVYPKDFESKASVTAILDDYNDRMKARGEDEKVVRYTDMVGTMMSSVTEIVDIISYVLVAFVGISLVVSSIMIGVITYISVMERRKEIGILRAIGASKRNVSEVFNAETFMIGLCAGVIGIGLTLLLLVPCNLVLHNVLNQPDLTASLSPLSGLLLIALSTLLTIIGGWIPAKSASKCNPVTALRSE